MKHQDFNQLVAARLSQCHTVLVMKDKEYSSDTDRLHNFYFAAQMQGISPVAALRGMWVKHIVSILDELKRLEDPKAKPPTKEWIKEKLGDNINYTLLCEGLFEDIREKFLQDNIASYYEDKQRYSPEEWDKARMGIGDTVTIRKKPPLDMTPANVPDNS